MRTATYWLLLGGVVVGCEARAPVLERQLCGMGLFISSNSMLEIELNCEKRFVVSKQDRVVMGGSWAVHHSDVGNYVEMVRDSLGDTYQFTWNGGCIHFLYPHADWGG